MMTLKKYHQKRDFKQTPEPKGNAKTTKKNNLYVIQKHAASHLHYDLRLQLGNTLKSWAVPKGPSLDPSVKRLAMQVEDHPIEYGGFEGIIPKGQYGGGTVMLWDTGQWIPKDTDPEKAYKKGHLTFELKGKKLKGEWSLIRMKNTPNGWLLIKANDKYARPTDEYDITEKRKNSVLSKKTMDQIAAQFETKTKVTTPKKKVIHLGSKKRMPANVSPQLATLVDHPPEGNEWLHEIKFDGYRLIAFIKNKKVTLKTRNNLNWTAKFSNIKSNLEKLSVQNAILDGEVVMLNKQGHSDFQLLQNSIKENKNKNFIYYVFDILYLNGHDLSVLPLIERKKLLQEILRQNKNAAILYSDHVIGSGKKVFEKSCKLKLEGIVSKNITSPYIQKRTKNWLKIKCSHRQEFVIGGYTLPKGNRNFFGSLLLGVYDKNKLIYCGHVGTGFNEKTLKEIYKKLKNNETSTMPFNKKPRESNYVHWVKPHLVVEVEFSEWTAEGLLRHPSFKGMRMDKSPKKIIKETPKTKKKALNHSEIKLTNPNRVLYPEQNITKLELFEYYKTIKKWILPYITNRPLTLVRCPSGNHKDCFFQKHIVKSSPSALKAFPIKEKSKVKDYIYLNNVDGLLTLPQLGVLEIHTWNANIKTIDKPDMMIFDLDPAPDVSWGQVVAAAKEIKKQLTKLKLKSFVKTTGGKGLHVVVPIKPHYEWEIIKDFARSLVDYLVKQDPAKYIGTMNIVKRKGKIFIDYFRNNRGATSIAPYSTRARPNASVSTPVHWSELTNNIKDTYYTVKTLPGRLKKLRKDPWKDFFKIKQSLRL
jgi:bifunctional non-homologous end joining protein LigD